MKKLGSTELEMPASMWACPQDYMRIKLLHYVPGTRDTAWSTPMMNHESDTYKVEYLKAPTAEELSAADEHVHDTWGQAGREAFEYARRLFRGRQ